MKTTTIINATTTATLGLTAVSAFYVWSALPVLPAEAPVSSAAPQLPTSTVRRPVWMDVPATLWQARLRNPRRDNNTSKPKPNPPKANTLRTRTQTKPSRAVNGPRLIGTVIEPGRSVAIIDTRESGIVFLKVGDDLPFPGDPTSILEIRDREATVGAKTNRINWRLGERLELARLEFSSPSEMTDQSIAPPKRNMKSKMPQSNAARIDETRSDDDPVTSSAASELDQRRSMTLEEELDFLNGDEFEDGWNE